MDSEGFLMDAATAAIFYRFRTRYKITNREDRILVLRELVRRKKAKYLRDVKPIVAGKKILTVGFKPPHNPGPEHWCDECKLKEKE